MQHLRLGKMADADFRHDRDRDRVHDALDQLEAAHPRNAAHRANVGGNALQRHDGHGAGFLGDDGLLRRDDVHDDAAFEHLREPALDGYGSGHVSMSLSYQAISNKDIRDMSPLRACLGYGGGEDCESAERWPPDGCSPGLGDAEAVAGAAGVAVGSGRWRQMGMFGFGRRRGRHVSAWA